jgi:PDZ domain-containing protein
VAVFLFLVVVAAVVLNAVHVDYYAETPGDAQSVAPFITVPSSFHHHQQGKILLTDVYLDGPLSVLSYLFDSNNSDDHVVPTKDLLGPTPQPQFAAQGFLDMSQSQSSATAVALTRLGYNVQAQSAGVLVYQVGVNVPAAKVLQVGQVITSVNGKATRDACGLITALSGLKPGSAVSLRVEQSSLNNSGQFVSGKTVSKTVALAKPLNGEVSNQCPTPITPTAILGIGAETQINWTFPIKVTVRTPGIGGPSAGLAMTLGIINDLSGGHLIGNHTVAATGTIDAAGNVGDVGGVPQKTIAVERAGATVFFVPPPELAAAKSKATPQLHVYAVSTLDQALFILKALGGTIPASHVQPQASP